MRICKQLDSLLNNLWVMLHRARKQLKSCLESNWIDDGVSKMLTCKQVSKALAEHRYYELPWYQSPSIFHT